MANAVVAFAARGSRVEAVCPLGGITGTAVGTAGCTEDTSGCTVCIPGCIACTAGCVVCTSCAGSGGKTGTPLASAGAWWLSSSSSFSWESR